MHYVIAFVITFVWSLFSTAEAASLDQVASGSLLLRTETPGIHVEAPTVSTDIKIDVTGPIARTVLTQRFRNPSDGWVEGIYAFPLPDEAAVDTLRMRIGDRFVEGRIEERVLAQELYQDAKAEGKAAALTEQHRPNLFTTSVANIGPGAVIVTQIEFQSALAPKDGEFSLRMPLVAPPRYGDEPIAQAVSFGAEGWAIATPATPIADPREEGEADMRNPVTLTVSLAPGFPLARVDSRFHQVAVEEMDGATLITLNGPVKADRDFELVWTAKPGAAPTASLFQDEATETPHRILTLSPPDIASNAIIPPRDVIFVQDVSGSMAGESIRQARAGLETAIRRLRPEDRFNIIAFNDEYRLFSPKPLTADQKTIAKAIRAVRGLEADGGTNMVPALDRALRMQSEAGRVRQIVFLTDGAVSFENELLNLIHEKRGAARLFMVGIGSAPNSFFMSRAAEIGRGAHVYIGDLNEVQTKMEALFAKIENPAVTGLAMALPDGVEAAPSILPDLYAGEPLTIALKGEAAAPLILSGMQGERPFRMEIDLSNAAARPGVAKLFARRKIKSLEASLVMSADPLVVDREILDTSLGYGLVSRMTSLIAIDDEPLRPFAAPLTRAEIARNLPAGWDPAQFVFEATPVQAPGRRADIPSLLTAPSPITGGEDEAGVMIPKGSLGWRLLVIIGVLTAAAGILTTGRRARV